ncbi:hypothetical protein Q9966_006322 [Columba livia]|nr:hypothetical protein Q9966_006322 [Columba livia]
MALGGGQGGRWCRRAPVLRRRLGIAEGLEAASPARPYAAAVTGGAEAASGEELLEVCRRRHFLRGGAEPRPWRAYLSGCPPAFGPLGVGLRDNLAAQWWDSTVASREQVFAVDAPLHGPPAAGAPRAGPELRLLHPETLRGALRGDPAAEEELRSAGALRESLLPGASLVLQRLERRSRQPARCFLTGSEAAGNFSLC